MSRDIIEEPITPVSIQEIITRQDEPLDPMTPREEMQDLKENPLPPVVIMDPLARVWCLDGQISALQEEIAELTRQRAETLDYAVANGIQEDTRCRLEKKVKRFRTLDVARFRQAFPEEFMMACDIERKEKEEALTHLGERINLTLVDKLVKRPILEAAQGVITVKESITYSVVPK